MYHSMDSKAKRSAQLSLLPCTSTWSMTLLPSRSIWEPVHAYTRVERCGRNSTLLNQSTLIARSRATGVHLDKSMQVWAAYCRKHSFCNQCPTHVRTSAGTILGLSIIPVIFVLLPKMIHCNSFAELTISRCRDCPGVASSSGGA
mmetsp:Transcript_836/g.3288  ORF Transcript_836/g.3288 Transcript_836/m.3288 type:complete len:145 (+) Transcript_836:490-924(+)